MLTQTSPITSSLDYLPSTSKVKAAIFTYQLLRQFDGDDGKVSQLFGEQKSARECYVNSLKNQEKEEAPRKRKHHEPEEPLPFMGHYVAENPKCYEWLRPANRYE